MSVHKDIEVRLRVVCSALSRHVDQEAMRSLVWFSPAPYGGEMW
jgi:hypothetical protein